MLGSLIGAAASLGGAFLGKSAAEKASERAYQHAQQQMAYQREFAQHGIQWRVEDAKRSGIHPLYALGAQTTSFAPVSVGSSSYDMGPALAKAGQDIGRAIDQTRTGPDRAGALQVAMATAQLDGLKIDNDIKRAELASKMATNVTRGPGFPMPYMPPEFDGQGDAVNLSGNKIKLETRRDVSQPGNPSYVAGSGPSVGVVKNSTGGYSIVMPPELAESYESDMMGSWDWQIRNRMLPFFNDNVSKPSIPHNPHTEMVIFNPWQNQWEVRKKGDTNAARREAQTRKRWRTETWDPSYGY